MRNQLPAHATQVADAVDAAASAGSPPSPRGCSIYTEAAAASPAHSFHRRNRANIRKIRKMSISTFNFQFYNCKLPAAMPLMPVSSFSELEMDIDEEEMEMVGATTPPITSTPLPVGKQSAATPTPRFTSELALAINGARVEEVREKPQQQQPVTQPLQELRPQLHRPQKRWSMELREKILEMSKRNNASSSESLASSASEMQQRFLQQLQQNEEEQEEEKQQQEEDDARSVSEKINFFNKLTNTFESARGSTNPCNGNGASSSNNSSYNNNNNNRFISLLRSSRPQGMATTTASTANGYGIPPPKPKRVGAASSSSSSSTSSLLSSSSYSSNMMKDNNGGFAIPTVPHSVQRKCSLRRKPSMEKSRASIARQNSNATLKPQRHAMMEDLSLVVPVRLRIAEYEQRISMSAA